jgi:hypothetical protein
MKTLGTVFIVLGLVVAAVKLTGVAGPAATVPLMILALVLAGGGLVLYRRARRREVPEQP